MQTYKVGPEINTICVGSVDQFVSLILQPESNLHQLTKNGIQKILCRSDGLSLEAIFAEFPNDPIFGGNEPTGLMERATDKGLCTKQCCSEYSTFDIFVDGIKFATMKPTLLHLFLPDEMDYHASTITIIDVQTKSTKGVIGSQIVENEFSALTNSPFNRVVCGDDLMHSKESLPLVDVTAYFSKCVSGKMADPILNSELRTLTHKKNCRPELQQRHLWNVAFMSGIQTQFVIRPVHKSQLHQYPRSISMKYMMGIKQSIRGTVDEFKSGVMSCLDICPLFPKSCIPPEYKRDIIEGLVVYGFCDISKDVVMLALYFYLPFGTSKNVSLPKGCKKKHYLEQHIKCVAFSRSDRIMIPDYSQGEPKDNSDDCSLKREHYTEFNAGEFSDIYQDSGEEDSEYSQEDAPQIPIHMGVGDVHHTMIHKLAVIRGPWWQQSKIYPQLYQKLHWLIIKKVILAINQACGTQLLISQKASEHVPSYHFKFYPDRIELDPIDVSYYEARFVSNDLDLLQGKLVNLKNFWMIIDAHSEESEDLDAFSDITDIIPLDEADPNDQARSSVIFNTAKYLLNVPYSCGGFVCKMSASAATCACCKNTNNKSDNS